MGFIHPLWILVLEEKILDILQNNSIIAQGNVLAEVMMSNIKAFNEAISPSIYIVASMFNT